MVNQVNREKLDAVISFFASNPSVPNLGKVKLWKLIYFADVEMAREFGGETITGSEYIKYKHGPVPSRGEKQLKKMARALTISAKPRVYHGHTLMEILPGDAPGTTEALTEDELKALQNVALKLGALTAAEIEERSHNEPAWLLAEEMKGLDPELMLYGTEEDPEGL